MWPCVSDLDLSLFWFGVFNCVLAVHVCFVAHSKYQPRGKLYQATKCTVAAAGDNKRVVNPVMAVAQYSWQLWFLAHSFKYLFVYVEILENIESHYCPQLTVFFSVILPWIHGLNVSLILICVCESCKYMYDISICTFVRYKLENVKMLMKNIRRTSSINRLRRIPRISLRKRKV